MDSDTAPLVSRRGMGLITSAGTLAAALPGSARADQVDQVAISYSSGSTAGPSTYWEMLRPAQGPVKPTLVLIPGGAHSSACYLATADGRPGWAHRFVQAGHPVVMADWPGTGRSGYVAPEALTGEVVCAGLGQVVEMVGGPVIVVTHSMSGAYGWKLLERHGDRIGKLVAVAPGPPGNIQPQAEIVTETPDKIELRGTTNYTLGRKTPFVATPGFVKGKLIGSSKLFPPDCIDRYAASLIAIPPRLLQQRLNVDGSQLRVDDATPFKGKPVLVLTGTDDTDHPREFDQRTADWLAEAGAKVDYWYLSDKGLDGNGHMMMLERNSDVLARLILSWIEGA